MKNRSAGIESYKDLHSEPSSPSRYYRVRHRVTSGINSIEQETVGLPIMLVERLVPGDGLVIGHWNDGEQVGETHFLAVVTGIAPGDSKVSVELTQADTILKPNPSGRRWWKNPFFKFAESVRERYMLDDLFAEHFPHYGEIALENSHTPRLKKPKTYIVTSGFVYVLRSQYGYKIGKTINLKGRTRLFAVKLPFEFDLALAEFVDNYSKVEADLHRQYAAKRLEGEWFDLDDSDLDQIRLTLQGASTPFAEQTP